MFERAGVRWAALGYGTTSHAATTDADLTHDSGGSEFDESTRLRTADVLVGSMDGAARTRCSSTRV
jgi:hypothetical protein